MDLRQKTRPAFPAATFRLLRHLLEITDFSRDLHFPTRATCDTLDYSGNALHEGSKLIWAAGEKANAVWPAKSLALPICRPASGIRAWLRPAYLLLRGLPAKMPRGEQDEAMNELCAKAWPAARPALLLAVVDDAAFCAQNLENFLWTTFTRADPAQDSYGAQNAAIQAKHWACSPPFALDARAKAWQPDPLTDDPAIVRKIEKPRRPWRSARGD